MQEQELKDIIEKIESSNSEEDAYIEFRYTDDNLKDKLFIRTTETGLRLLAAELLKVSIGFDKDTNNRLTRIRFDRKKWIHGYVIQYIQPWKKRPRDIENEIKNEKFINSNYSAPMGCRMTLIAILILAVIGFVALFGWIF